MWLHAPQGDRCRWHHVSCMPLLLLAVPSLLFQACAPPPSHPPILSRNLAPACPALKSRPPTTSIHSARDRQPALLPGQLPLPPAHHAAPALPAARQLPLRCGGGRPAGLPAGRRPTPGRLSHIQGHAGGVWACSATSGWAEGPSAGVETDLLAYHVSQPVPRHRIVVAMSGHRLDTGWGAELGCGLTPSDTKTRGVLWSWRDLSYKPT